MSGHFFISYSSKDAAAALAFKNRISQAKPVWMAPFSIPVGSSYAHEIPRAIGEADAFILLLSENSVRSKWVEKELDNALRADIPILPVKLDTCELSPSFLFYLSNCQIIDASEDCAAAMERVLQTVAVDPAYARRNDWYHHYCQSILKKLNISNKVFTLLDMEYSKRTMDSFLSLNSLLFEYELFAEKQLDETTLIEQPCRFIVYGQAGSGKTTLLLNLYYQTALRMDESGVLPVFLPLKAFQLGTLRNLRAIYDEINRHLESPLSPGDFIRFTASHKLICFLDGFDEFELDNGEIRDRLWEEIQSFATQNHCSLVVSVRTDSLPNFSEYDYVLIKPLRQAQMVEFIDKYFQYLHIDVPAETFVSQLPKGIRAILNTPLLISMVIAAYVRTRRRPNDENELYDIIVRELLAFKPLLPESQCTTDEKYLIVSKVAFEMLITGRASLGFDAYMDVLERAAAAAGVTVGAFEIHKDLLHSQIIEIVKNRVSFFHTSIMEFLSHCEINREYHFETKATMDQYFLKNNEKIRKIIQCVSPKATDDIIEVGAGIGTVSLALPAYRSLTLVDLDEGLCKILRYNFRKRQNVSVLQEDAIDALSRTECNKIISNRPFFLTNDVLSVLESKQFDCAVMSIRASDDISFYARSFLITEVDVLAGDDFFPEQPFQSRIVKLIKKQSKPSTEAV